jgi:hypothetical protein
LAQCQGDSHELIHAFLFPGKTGLKSNKIAASGTGITPSISLARSTDIFYIVYQPILNPDCHLHDLQASLFTKRNSNEAITSHGQLS